MIERGALNEKCRKCGNNRPKLKRHKVTGYYMGLVISEHLEVTCPDCKFFWQTDVLNKSESVMDYPCRECGQHWDAHSPAPGSWLGVYSCPQRTMTGTSYTPKIAQ